MRTSRLFFVCLTASAVIATIWLVSIAAHLSLHTGGPHSFAITEGCVIHSDLLCYPRAVELKLLRPSGHLGLVLPSSESVDIADSAGPLLWHTVVYPLWLPFLACALPTAYLFHRDRRRPTPNHCKHCNYDLTGNQSGTCPECGTTVPKSVPAAQSPPRDPQP